MVVDHKASVALSFIAALLAACGDDVNPAGGDGGSAHSTDGNTTGNTDGNTDGNIANGDTDGFLPPGPFPQLALTSAVGGSALPFSLGQVFERGRVPQGSTVRTDVDGVQIVPVSTWSDGSVRHAIIAGRVDLAAGTSRTLAFQGGSPGGAILTESDLSAAAPSAQVALTGKGTVQLAALVGTAALKKTEHAGPAYVAFQYVAAFPMDAQLRAVFFVQLWQGGAYRVRVVVENGHAVQTGAPAAGHATVTIGGKIVYDGSPAMPPGTRWDAVGFGGTDPQIVPSIDVAYLRRTKLVPNYGWTDVAPKRLVELGNVQYVPMGLADWEADQGGTGFNTPIGLMPHWDAVFACTGDPRGYAAVVAEARAYGTYSVFFRDDTTSSFPTMSGYATAHNSEDNTESFTGGGANPYRWEIAHHPNAGYLAWLITGERYFLETLQANVFASWLSQSGDGVGRLYSSQTRARAWRARSIAAAAAVSPDGDPFKEDCRTNLRANLQHWNDVHVVPNKPGTGLGAIYDDQEAAAGFQRSIFEHLFLASSVGWAWDFDLWASDADRDLHRAVRNYFYKIPVGLTGRGPDQGEYSYRRGPGPYRMTVGSGSDNASLFDSWGQVYTATYQDTINTADGQAIMESYADDNSEDAFPQGNWPHLITALSFAVDHGAPGAMDSYTRVTGASNWAANAAKIVYWPQNAVRPR